MAKVLKFIHQTYKRTEARLAFLAKLNQAQTATQRIGLTLQKEAISAQALMWSEQLTENQLVEHWLRMVISVSKIGVLIAIINVKKRSKF